MQDYLDQIANPFNVDYWADEGLSHAQSLVADFTDADWQRLAGLWPKMAAAQRVRCAETIGQVESAAAALILIGMLRDESVEVVVAAADRLRSMPPALLPPAGIDVADLSRIASLRSAAGKIDRLGLAMFLDRFADGRTPG